MDISCVRLLAFPFFWQQRTRSWCSCNVIRTFLCTTRALHYTASYIEIARANRISRRAALKKAIK